MLSTRERDEFLSLLLLEGLPKGACIEEQLRSRYVRGIALCFDLYTPCKVVSMSGKTYGIGLHGALSLKEQSHVLGRALALVIGLRGISARDSHTPLFWPVLRIDDVLIYPKPGSPQARKARREEMRYCDRFAELWLCHGDNEQKAFRFIRRLQKEKVILLM